jgi:hypothetical protein
MRAAKTGGVALLLTLASLAAQPAAAQPAASPSAAAPADDGLWHYAFTPYLWTMSQEGEASFKGIPPQPIEMSFGDILENLDFPALGAFEAHNGRWGVAADLLYMNLGAKVPRSVLGQPEPSDDARQFSFEATALYRLYRGAPREGMGSYVDLVAGARYNKVRAGLQTSLIPDTERSFDWVDGVIGARFQLPLAKKVALGARADVAGFGSDLTWQAHADLRAQLSTHWALGAGYRYIDTDYDEGTGADRKLWSMVNKGPYLAVQIGW